MLSRAPVSRPCSPSAPRSSRQPELDPAERESLRAALRHHRALGAAALGRREGRLDEPHLRGAVPGEERLTLGSGESPAS